MSVVTNWGFGLHLFAKNPNSHCLDFNYLANCWLS